MKIEVDYFLNNLKKSRELDLLMKKKLLHKTLQRTYKANPSKEKTNIFKRRISTNYDVALSEYLLHSRLIKDCKENQQNDIHLKDVFDQEKEGFNLLERKKTLAHEKNLDSINEEYQISERKYSRIETINSPHVILASLKKNRKNSVLKLANDREKNKTTKGKKEIKSFYYKIKRNNAEIDSSDEFSRNGDDSLISNSEVVLDRMYQKSIDLQKKVLQEPEKNFSKRFKEIMKLDELNYQIHKTIEAKFA